MSKPDFLKFNYASKEYGVGDELTVWFHRSGTDFIARSDEGIIMLPLPGSRMVSEMLIEGWKIVEAKVNVKCIKKTRKGTYVIWLQPLSWRGLFK